MKRAMEENGVESIIVELTKSKSLVLRTIITTEKKQSVECKVRSRLDWWDWMFDEHETFLVVVKDNL